MNVRITIALLAFARLGSGETSIERGASFLRAGRYQEALSEFVQAQREQPGNALIQNLTGITLTQLDRIEEANQHYRAAIRISDRLETAHKNLGFNLLGAKRYSEAESELQKALLLDPKDSFNHYYLGLVYWGTGRKQLAVEHLGQAQAQLAKDPDTALSFVGACFELGDRKSADELILRVISERSLTDKQAYDWACRLSSQRRYSEAVTLFKYVAQIRPGTWSGEYNLGIALLDDKRPAEAVPIFQALSRTHGDNADVYGLLGAALELAGKASDALDAYAHALQLEPENSDRYLEYSRLLMELDRFDESSQLIEKGIGQVSDSYGLEMRLGSVLMATGKLADARQVFDRAISQHPEISLGYIGTARTYLLEGQPEKAIATLATAGERAKTDFLVYYFAGLAFERANRPQDSLNSFRKAAALGPDVPEVHYEQGKLFLKLGDLPKAAEEFKKTITLDPKHAGAFYQLSLLWQRRGEPGKASHFAALSRDLLSQKHQEAIERLDQRLHNSEWKSLPSSVNTQTRP